MGSFKRKFNNKQQKKQDIAAANELIDLKKQMQEQVAAEQYVEAMDTMAEIAKHKKMDPEIMCMGATCYFMTGDYERAAKWINNTLAYDAVNVSARILLARLCFVQDQETQGFAILSMVVEQLQAGMNAADKDMLLEMLVYCNDNMAEEMSQYPKLVEYFKKNYTAPEKSLGVSIQDMLEASLPPAEEKAVEAKPADAGKAKAQAAVDRLKALLNKSKKNNIVTSQPVKQDAAEQEAVVPEMANNTACDGAGDTMTPETFMAAVMAKDVSLKDKIKMLNTFAGGLYVNEDYDGAFKVLSKALEVDAYDAVVLKNIAYVCLSMKDKEKAMQYASKMPMMDFALLRSIKGKCHG